MDDSKSPISLRESNSVEDVLAEARERADFGYSYWDEMHREWTTDLAFLDGEQWDPEEKVRRIGAGRPVLTINTLPQYVDQVYGDILQNRPSISVAPSDSTGASVKMASVDGVSDFTLAKVYEGLIRNIEYVCGAETHYDTAVLHSIQTGMGWLRVFTRYTQGLTMDQEAYIAAIRNRWAVIMDPLTDEPDMSDAMWGFIFTDMQRKEFQKRWPGKTFESIGDDTDTNHFAWWTDGDVVRTAEYFTREPSKRTMVELSDGRVMWEDQLKGEKEDPETGKKSKFDVTDDLAKEGITIRRSRDLTTYKVVWRRITGRDVLEGPKDWPGDTIPIVPVAGKRIDYSDKSLWRGLIYHAKDAKVAENYYISASIERISLAPKSPWIVEAEMVEGYESIWKTANTVNHAYLPYNRSLEGAKPERADGPVMPAAELQMSAIFTDKVKAALGMYDASVGNRSNETSGKAIMARQREADVGSYVFADNLNKAIRRIGLILCDVIPKIMDGERVVRLRDRDGSGDWVEINKTVKDEQTGLPVIINDIQAGKMDVVVKAGPSYTTQRVEAVEALMEFVRVVPAAGAVILDKIAANMDWPGADEVAQRLIKLVPQQFLTPREIEDNKIAEQKPTPEQEVAMATAKGELATAEASVKTAEANIAMAQAKTEEAKVKLAEINSLAAGGDAMAKQIKDAVAAALAELMAVANNTSQAAPQPNAPAAQPAIKPATPAKKAPAKKAAAKK